MKYYFLIFCDKKWADLNKGIYKTEIFFLYICVTKKWADLKLWNKISDFLWQENGQTWRKECRKLQNIIFYFSLWLKSGQIWRVKGKNFELHIFLIFCDKKMGRFEEKNIKNWKYSVLFFVTKKWADLKLWEHVWGAISSIYTSTFGWGSLDMDYWCSAFGTKGARVNTGYGTPNMFWNSF